METDLPIRIVLCVALVGSGILLIWAARAAASGRLKRNQIAGIRIPSTLASDEAWLAAHVRAKRPSMLAGVAAMVSGLCVLLPVSEVVMAIIVVAGCVAMLGFVFYGARVGAQAARALSGSGDPSE